MTIRAIYFPKADGTPVFPDFPPTDQHPDALRYLVGVYVVDAVGVEPTTAEVDAVIQAKLDTSDIDNLEKVMKSLALLTRKYANELKAGTYVTKTIADLKADFRGIFQALP